MSSKGNNCFLPEAQFLIYFKLHLCLGRYHREEQRARERGRVHDLSSPLGLRVSAIPGDTGRHREMSSPLQQPLKNSISAP